MLKQLTLAMLTSTCLLAAPAIAQDDDTEHFLGGSFSANVAIATDYTFRGISQNSGDPAVSGGVDWASDLFYVGTWASTVDFNDDITDPFTGEQISDGSQLELDLYFGVTPTVGDVSLDFGAIFYVYPGAPQGEDDVFVPLLPTVEQADLAAALGLAPGDALIDFNDQNYVELHAAASYTVGLVDLGFNLTYSPDYYFETGNVLIPDVSVSFPLGQSVPFAGSDLSFAFSANLGYLGFIDNDIPEGAGFGENYFDLGAGVTATWFGLDFDARYIDTFGLAGNGSTGIFTISKSF